MELNSYTGDTAELRAGRTRSTSHGDRTKAYIMATAAKYNHHNAASADRYNIPQRKILNNADLTADSATASQKRIAPLRNATR